MNNQSFSRSQQFAMNQPQLIGLRFRSILQLSSSRKYTLHNDLEERLVENFFIFSQRKKHNFKFSF